MGAIASRLFSLHLDMLNIAIKSGRGTWPCETAATCEGKVRTPRDGANMTDAMGPNNAGLLTWNISQRISSARDQAREARLLVEDAEERRSKHSTTMRGLLGEIEDAAATVDATWERILAVVSDQDPDLIEPTESGVSVIHSRGSNPELVQKIETVWAEDQGVARVSELSEQLQRLADDGDER